MMVHFLVVMPEKGGLTITNDVNAPLPGERITFVGDHMPGLYEVINREWAFQGDLLPAMTCVVRLRKLGSDKDPT